MRFHAIESEPRLSEEFGEKRNSSTLYWDMYSQTASLLFLMIHIPYINLCAISLNRNRKQHIPKIPKKVTLQRHLLNDFYQKLIDINLPLDNTKYKISSELYMRQYFCHTHTDRHFPEIVKSCSVHPKTYKSIKNQNSKNFTIPTLLSYIEYRKML